MLIHHSSLFRIYFGNAHDQIYPSQYSYISSHPSLFSLDSFNGLHKALKVKEVLFLRQTHSAYGYQVNAPQLHPLFTLEGDYLITKSSGLGLGIMSADCLPIVFIDIMNMAVAIAHAGWRGSVAGIAVTVFNHMKELFHTDKNQLRIFFGPSARPCCYMVKKEFTKELEHFSFASHVLHEKEDYFLFDLPYFNRLQLENIGIPKQAFRCEYNICTICDETFFSYRRQKEAAGRQMTVVALR